jgi:hypothetical protein
VLLLVIAIAVSSDAAVGRDHTHPSHLTIFVDGDVPASSTELRRAAMDVIEILGAIRVVADWVFDGAPAAGQAASAFMVHVAIVARTPVPPSSAAAVTLGMTLPARDGSSADILVFYDHVVEFARAHRTATPSVLALVVAHEVGHALLPSPGHASTGIMQAAWDGDAIDRASRHDLGFTPQQGAWIRQRLMTCCSETGRRKR